jgi:BirA family transcriptional regulator, biotin operon repressor / biotin---[acetyl-CoA-carboxylase] ligase
VAEWAERWQVPQLFVFARIPSTNDLAVTLARHNAVAGTVLLADEQTAGRGRGTNAWSSAPGLGIWMSVVLRPDTLVDARVLPLLLGLAVSRALSVGCAPAEVRVKWPNDVLAGGRKVAGILCEASWERDRLAFVVAGIGINVHHSEGDFPPKLRGSATSVAHVADARPERAAIVGALLAEVRTVLAHPVLDASTLSDLARRDALLGREVVVQDGPGAPLRGTAAGIAADGTLQLRLAGGEVRGVRTGTVRALDDAVPGPRTRAGA